MTPQDTLILFVAFCFKHFIVDFPLQPKYMWANKGTYGHLGGLLHAGLHGASTLLVLVSAYYLHVQVRWEMLLLAATVDAVVHYHVDWAKMNINRAKGWTATTHPEFWNLVGLDQLLHYLTYVGVIYMCM